MLPDPGLLDTVRQASFSFLFWGDSFPFPPKPIELHPPHACRPDRQPARATTTTIRARLALPSPAVLEATLPPSASHPGRSAQRRFGAWAGSSLLTVGAVLLPVPSDLLGAQPATLPHPETPQDLFGGQAVRALHCLLPSGWSAARRSPSAWCRRTNSERRKPPRSFDGTSHSRARVLAGEGCKKAGGGEGPRRWSASRARRCLGTQARSTFAPSGSADTGCARKGLRFPEGQPCLLRRYWSPLESPAISRLESGETQSRRTWPQRRTIPGFVTAAMPRLVKLLSTRLQQNCLTTRPSHHFLRSALSSRLPPPGSPKISSGPALIDNLDRLRRNVYVFINCPR